MRDQSVGWTSIHLIALLHRDIGLSSAQCFELAQALNVTPNELDRKMSEAVEAFESLTEEGPQALTPSPNTPVLEELSSGYLPFIATTQSRRVALAARVYRRERVSKENLSYYQGLPRLQNLAEGEKKMLQDYQLSDSTFPELAICKVVLEQIYEPRMLGDRTSSRRSRTFRYLADPRTKILRGLELARCPLGVFPPESATPVAMWWGLHPTIRKEILHPSTTRINAFAEYLRLQYAYGYASGTARNLAGLTSGQVRAAMDELKEIMKRMT